MDHGQIATGQHFPGQIVPLRTEMSLWLLVLNIVCLSVCLSLCPSHSCIGFKRQNISPNFIPDLITSFFSIFLSPNAVAQFQGDHLSGCVKVHRTAGKIDEFQLKSPFISVTYEIGGKDIPRRAGLRHRPTRPWPRSPRF